MDNYLNIVFKSINLTSIDIAKDEVNFFTYNNGLAVNEKVTYEEYYNRVKKQVHPDYVSLYFDKISINSLQNNNDCNIINYQKLSSDLSYDNYVDIIRLIEGNIVLIISFKNDKDLHNGNESSNQNEISNDITDLIMNIENTLESISRDNYEIDNLYNYFTSLLDDIIRKNPDINRNYSNKLINKINSNKESLLIVDDDKLTRSIFKKAFCDNYDIIEAENGEEAVEIFEKNILNNGDKHIVGVFLDLKMPVMDGFAVLDFLKSKHILNRFPVIIVSADDSKDTKEKIYTYEIADMIEKPFNFEIIVKRVNNMVRMYSKNNYINEIIKSQDKELRKYIKYYVNAYIVDNEANYNRAVKVMDVLLNGYEENVAKSIKEASKYYDLGIKLVPYNYFTSFNSLNDEEKKAVYAYPKNGAKMLSYVINDENSLLYRYASDITKMHNERYDGTGFPNFLKGEEIPEHVYLVNIAYEVASYLNKNIAKEEIIKTIQSKNGTKYSPKSIEIFNNHISEI